MTAVETPERVTGRNLGDVQAVADRLAFLKPPFTLENVAASADILRADLLLLDYIQRIRPPGDSATRTTRGTQTARPASSRRPGCPVAPDAADRR
jgi:hypothetical protein